MQDLERKNYLFTILRNGEYKTIVDAHSNPIVFLKIEKELGNDTQIIFMKEITDQEFKLYTSK